jgi:hypothetical protein
MASLRIVPSAVAIHLETDQMSPAYHKWSHVSEQNCGSKEWQMSCNSQRLPPDIYLSRYFCSLPIDLFARMAGRWLFDVPVAGKLL